MACEQLDIRAGAVHLVRFSGMDGLLLHRLDAQSFQLLVKDLAEVHDDGLVDLLPQMRTEDLDERNLQRGNLAVQEDTGKVQLNLETDVHVCSVDGWGPPEGEATVRDLVQTGPLGVGELLELHRL